jgi:hypothetical protein
MPMLVEGTEGIIQIGPSNALTTVGYVNEFSVECEREMQARGPWIGNDTKQKTRSAKTSKGSLNADAVKGRDGGQAKLIELFESGADVRLVLKGGDGTDDFTYTCANAGMSAIKWGKTAEEGNTFEFSWEDMDGYTLVPST